MTDNEVPAERDVLLSHVPPGEGRSWVQVSEATVLAARDADHAADFLLMGRRHMTINLNDGLDFPTATEAKKIIADRLDAESGRILASARRIAKECVRVLIAKSVNSGGETLCGFRICEALAGVNYRGTCVPVNEITVPHAACLLRQEGYVVYRTGGLADGELRDFWSDLHVRLPTKNENPIAGGSVSRST